MILFKAENLPPAEKLPRCGKGSDWPMLLDDLIKCLPEFYTQVDIDLVRRAYAFAERAHADQIRDSGEPYITHCVAVAMILAEMKLSVTIIAAALLHDTIEDNEAVTDEVLTEEFGEEIHLLVSGVTKLRQIKRMEHDRSTFGPIDRDRIPAEAESAPEIQEPEAKERARKKVLKTENTRKTILAMADDHRVIFIKLADRLHNMRTLGYTTPEKQKRIAQETLDIYAALANRLGIYRFKWELEDLSFRYLYPEQYAMITESIAATQSAREREIQKIQANITEVMAQAGIKCTISGRSKHIYSIYQKMMDRGKPLEELRDLRGLRLIVDDIPSCYAALGQIHTHWRPIPNEFDDYIASPKENSYQSLHTAVVYSDGKPREVQIRTVDMHKLAEYGVARHWRYKERGKIDEMTLKKVEFLRRAKDLEKDGKSADEFMEHIREELKDRVEVFTPNQDLINLPIGSTPIDFAYTIHTEVGNRCRGAKVNGKMVPLSYKLKNGDVVSITTTKSGGPSRDWLNQNLGLVNTQRARSKINSWFKKQDREQNLVQGRDMVQKELKRLGLADPDFNELAKSFEYKNADDMFVGVGCGDLSIFRIITRLSEAQKPSDLPFSKGQTGASSGIAIEGLGKGIYTTLGKCCSPAPGDPIVGYITKGRGATIHKIDCPNLARVQNPERILPVSWGSGTVRYPVSITIQAYDRKGLVNEITNLLVKENINLINFNVMVTHNYVTIKSVIEVIDISELMRILTKIHGLPNVVDAYRDRPG